MVIASLCTVVFGDDMIPKLKEINDISSDADYLNLEKKERGLYLLKDAFDMGSMVVENFAIVAYGVTDHMYVMFTGIGDTNSTEMNLGLVAKFLLLCGAKSFICAHNHPSQLPIPGDTDKESAKTIQELADLIDCELLEDYVLTDEEWWAMTEDENGFFPDHWEGRW